MKGRGERNGEEEKERGVRSSRIRCRGTQVNATPPEPTYITWLKGGGTGPGNHHHTHLQHNNNS